MFDYYIIVFLLVMTIVLLIGNVYLVVEWQHTDDKNQAYAPKALVIFGLLLIEITLLLLPLDVQNSNGQVGCSQGWNNGCGGLDMTLAWSIMYCTIAVMSVIVYPYAIFYYEADDGMDPSKSPACSAASYTFLSLVVALVTTVCMFQFLATTEIPVETYSADIFDFQDVAVTASCIGDVVTCTMTASDDLTAASSYETSSDTLNLNVSFPVYLMALMAFVGYWFFVLFGGIGLAALPIDLILGYVYRPKRIDQKRFREEEKGIKKRSQDLIEIGQLLKKERTEFARAGHSMWERRKRRQKDTITVNKFKQMVFILEQDYEQLKMSYANHKNFNPLVPYAMLLFGVISAILSLLWMLQIILFLLVDPPTTSFLNEYFAWYDKWFPLFGIISVCIFTFYLMACVVKGCFKFGVRCFCIELHPMKRNGTYMNSFLFNVGLLLICSLPVVHFATEAFADYAADTDVHNIFNVQVRYLIFFNEFFGNQVFVYMLLILALLSALYLLYKPKDAPASASKMKEILKRNAEYSRL